MKGVPACCFDGFCELVDGLLEIDADGLEGFGIDGDAFHFHANEDGEEGGFDFGEDFVLAGFLEERAEFFGELEGDVGVLGGVFGEGVQGDGFDVEVFGLG